MARIGPPGWPRVASWFVVVVRVAGGGELALLAVWSQGTVVAFIVAALSLLWIESASASRRRPSSPPPARRSDHPEAGEEQEVAAEADLQEAVGQGDRRGERYPARLPRGPERGSSCSEQNRVNMPRACRLEVRMPKNSCSLGYVQKLDEALLGTIKNKKYCMQSSSTTFTKHKHD